MKIKALMLLSSLICLLGLSYCNEPDKKEEVEDSPTSGKLNVYYDEGLELHIRNQAATFESLYPRVSLKLFSSSESRAVQALFEDSCEAIVISRPLSDDEKKAFASKNYFPKFSVVAITGVALLTSTLTPVDNLSYEEVLSLLNGAGNVKDSTGKTLRLQALLDKNNSSVTHYLKDSLLHGAKFSSNCSILGSSLESLDYITKHPNVIALIDFAWFSDQDDALFKKYKDKIKFVRSNQPGSNQYEFPNQSSFKLNTYPFRRNIYVYRKTGDFTLAKGFESFVAGPKGQTIFLKQGLLPARQPGREIHANTSPFVEDED